MGGVRSVAGSTAAVGSWDGLQKVVSPDKLQLSDGCGACLLDFGDTSEEMSDNLPLRVARTCGQFAKANELCTVVAIIDSCSHVFHSECIRKWATKENSCPQCKQIFGRISCYVIDGRRIDTHRVSSRRLSKTLESDGEAAGLELSTDDDAEDVSGDGGRRVGAARAAGRARTAGRVNRGARHNRRGVHPTVTDRTLCSLCECPGAEALLVCSGPCSKIVHYFCAGLEHIPTDTTAWRCTSCATQCPAVCTDVRTGGTATTTAAAGRQRGRRRRVAGAAGSAPVRRRGGRTGIVGRGIRSRTNGFTPTLLERFWDIPLGRAASTGDGCAVVAGGGEGVDRRAGEVVCGVDVHRAAPGGDCSEVRSSAVAGGELHGSPGRPSAARRVEAVDRVVDDCVFTRAPPTYRGLPPDHLDNDEFEQQLYGRVIGGGQRDTRLLRPCAAQSSSSTHAAATDSGHPPREYISLLDELLAPPVGHTLVRLKRRRLGQRVGVSQRSSNSRVSTGSALSGAQPGLCCDDDGGGAVASACSGHVQSRRLVDCSVAVVHSGTGAVLSGHGDDEDEAMLSCNAGAAVDTEVNSYSSDSGTVLGGNQTSVVVLQDDNADANSNGCGEVDTTGTESFTDVWFNRVKMKFGLEENCAGVEEQSHSHLMRSDVDAVDGGHVQSGCADGDAFWLDIRELADEGYTVPVDAFYDGCSVDCNDDVPDDSQGDTTAEVGVERNNNVNGDCLTDGEESLRSASVSVPVVQTLVDGGGIVDDDVCHEQEVGGIVDASQGKSDMRCAMDAAHGGDAKTDAQFSETRDSTSSSVTKVPKSQPVSALVDLVRVNLERLEFAADLKVTDKALWRAAFKRACKRIVESENEKHHERLSGKTRTQQHKFWKQNEGYLRKAVQTHIGRMDRKRGGRDP